MSDIDVVGVDLSKNHYGICHIHTDGKIHFLYSYFKPYLQRDYKSRTEKFYSEVECSITSDNFSFEKVRYSYDDKNYNEIVCDALKSKINVNALSEYLEKKMPRSKMVVLEDYVASGTKIIQLVHVGESFKYYLANLEDKTGIVLFLCSVGTWRKFMCQDIKLKTDDIYVKINIALEKYHKPVFDFIHSVGQPTDVIKEMIDSYALANIKRHFGEVFKKNYGNRIFIF